MPISGYYKGHGSEVMDNMTKEYGDKKGKSVFYATANKRGLKPMANGDVVDGPSPYYAGDDEDSQQAPPPFLQQPQPPPSMPMDQPSGDSPIPMSAGDGPPPYANPAANSGITPQGPPPQMMASAGPPPFATPAPSPAPIAPPPPQGPPPFQAPKVGPVGQDPRQKAANDALAAAATRAQQKIPLWRQILGNAVAVNPRFAGIGNAIINPPNPYDRALPVLLQGSEEARKEQQTQNQAEIKAAQVASLQAERESLEEKRKVDELVRHEMHKSPAEKFKDLKSLGFSDEEARVGSVDPKVLGQMLAARQKTPKFNSSPLGIYNTSTGEITSPAAPKPPKAGDINTWTDTLHDPNATPEQKARAQANIDTWKENTKDKPPSTESGTWTLQEGADGKPVLLNSKTGETKAAPNGVQRSGTKAKQDAATEKEQGPARSALDYATNYLKNGVFTGSGDEALQEKFFELAKPATGFRMTQPQMDMLQNSRGWMSSLAAKARHATTGTWFDDEQRKQIVRTMNDLAKAKLGTGVPSGPSAGGGPVTVMGHIFPNQAAADAAVAAYNASKGKK